MLGWLIRARACRSVSNRARTSFDSMPRLISLRATFRSYRLELLGLEDLTHAAFPSFCRRRKPELRTWH